MNNQLIFDFKTDISRINVSSKLNNPFGLDIPEIARIAAKEFQQFIASEFQDWKYDFRTQKGKMFGILVIQKEDNTYGYLGTVSGKFPSNETCNKFIPSIFDDSVDDFFINKGMTELTEIGNKIKKSNNQSEIIFLHTASAATVTIFCPAASPVVNSKIKKTDDPFTVVLTSINFPCFVLVLTSLVNSSIL